MARNATIDGRRLTAIAAAGVDAARDAYRSAIAAELRGDPSAEHWERWRGIVARLWLLASLEGAGGIARMAKAMGVDPTAGPDLPVIRTKSFARGVAPRRFQIDGLAEFSDVFAVAEFREAIDAFVRKNPISRRAFEQLIVDADAMSIALMQAETAGWREHLIERNATLRRAINESFFVSDVSIGQTVSIKELVAQSIAGDLGTDELGRVAGLDLPDFIHEAQKVAPQLTDSRLETVLRNASASAASEGQIAQMADPAVQRVAPLVMLSNPKDPRSRETHRRMDGYINTFDEFSRLGLFTPNGHNCRCTWRGVSATEARQKGLIDADGNVLHDRIRSRNGRRQELIDGGEYPDPGWISRPMALS